MSDINTKNRVRYSQPVRPKQVPLKSQQPTHPFTPKAQLCGKFHQFQGFLEKTTPIIITFNHFNFLFSLGSKQTNQKVTF